MIPATDLHITARQWAGGDWHYQISGEAELYNATRTPLILDTSAWRDGFKTRADAFSAAVFAIGERVTENVPVTVSLHTLAPLVAEHMDSADKPKRNGSGGSHE